MAFTSLILGIVGVCFSLSIFTYPVSFICGILCLIFGFIGLSKDKENKSKAVTGIILGIITLIIFTLVSFFMYDLIMNLIDNLPKIMEEVLEYFDNEKEMLINDIIKRLKENMPF